MKYTTILAAAVLTLAASNTFAATTTFYDDTIYWDGFSNGSADDTDDVIGNPDLSSISVTDLKTVAVSSSTDIPDGILYNDFSGIRDGLFINVDGNSTDVTGWDYFIQGTYDGSSSSFKYTLYTVSASLDSDYILSSDLTSLSDASYRQLHPVAIKSSALSAGTDVTSLVDASSSTSVLYDFLSMGIALTDTYTISYVNSCANDVIVGATPIPGSALLFGSALFGIFGFKRFKNDAV